MDTCYQKSPAQSALLNTFGVIYAAVFIISGVLGFFPQFAPDHVLFHVFKIDPIHALVHITTGLIALWSVGASTRAVQIFFRWFGVIYAIIAIVGFWYGDAPILGVLLNNVEDAWLHLIAAIIALILGFCTCCHHSKKEIAPKQ